MVEKEPLAMRRMPKAIYLWPGLPQLWSRGSWYGLAAAVVAAGALNLLLAATFGWSELVPSSMRIPLWIGVLAGWITAGVGTGIWDRWHNPAGDLHLSTDSFCRALEFYLKEDYFQAERLLSGLLRQDPRDLEARLMLATLMRRSGRFDEAIGQLDRLARIEGADKWELEMRRERELLAEPDKTTDCPVQGHNRRDSVDRKHAA